MNDWVDVNCFVTVGKSLLSGQVLYRDIYEQKGPLLYFLYAFLSLISSKSFISVFVLEVMSFSLYLYFSAKCAALHIKNERILNGCIAVLAAMVASAKCFAHGGSVEQICLWMIPYSLYLIESALHQHRRLSCRESLVIGILCGISFYLKFTITSFFFGLSLFVAVWYIAFEKSARELIGIIAAFLAGVALISAPVIAYFAVHGAMEDFITGYFFNNIFRYSLTSIVHTLINYLAHLLDAFKNDTALWTISTVGFVWLFLQKENRKISLAFFLSFLFLSLTTMSASRAYSYYALIFAGFSIYGLIAAVRWLSDRLPAKNPTVCRFSHRIARLITPLLIAGLLAMSYFLSGNTYLLHYEKDDLPQYQFASYIRRYKNPTLLNYGFLDGGFYFAADVLPQCKYFAKLNLDLPEMNEEQTRQIEEGLVDFVVAKNVPLEDCALDSSLYQLVMERPFYFEERIQTYYLYQKIGLPSGL